MKHLRAHLRFSTRLLLVFFFSYAFNSHAQTQGIDTVIYAQGSVNGYYVSLPPNYQANPTKKYPLLIALHGKGEKGDGSATDMPKLLSADGSIAQRLDNNNFPGSFTVDDETFSFIVVCPQYSSGWNKYLLQDVKSKFRVDAERVYLTGLSEGGAKAWSMVAANYWGYTGPDSVAAIFLVCPSINPEAAALGSYAINTVSKSNLPFFGSYNNGEPNTYIKNRVDSVVANLNSTLPAVNPQAKKVVFIASAHDAWTKTYNPANIIDSANGYNMYQWFLQYRNKILVAKAGKDTTITLPTDTVTLSGSKSTARKGRIAAYLWTKIAGPASYTIASPTTAVTGVSGLTEGTYQFELKVTHDSSSSITARDTLTVTVNPDPNAPQTQGIDTVIYRDDDAGIRHGYYVSLPAGYASNPTKKYPLLIALHANGQKGDGSPLELPEVLTVPGTIPYMVNNNTFPASFTVNNENFSFIVVCPQYDLWWSKYLLENIKANFRVDPERIYITGHGEGGAKSWTMASSGYWGHTGPDSLSAVALVSPSITADAEVAIGSAPINRVNASNLPVMGIYNNGDPSAALKRRVDSLILNLNSTVPAVEPPAKKVVYSATGTDSWTKTYNPANIIDSANGYNLYQWLLQFRNKTVVAYAGKDTTIAASSITLNGSKSTARRGRIASYLWTKISGGSVTIASNTSATTNVTGLSAGTYQFELKVTHDSSTIAKDTITVIVTSGSPRVAPTVNGIVSPAAQTDEMLSAKISPTVAHSQITVVITGRATGKANLQVSSMDGKRLQQQSFVKDATSTTRAINVSGLPAGTYVVEVIVNGKHRRVLRFVKQ